MLKGTKLGDRYEILGEVGRGGMGVVYRALDPLLGREVAIKLIPPALLTEETAERFQREARLVARMDHPDIVPVYDIGRHLGSLFFVMPLLPGTTLRALLKEGSLRLEEILEVGIHGADALDYSHCRGVIHRDVKPANVMVEREEGVPLRARLMDFGLARTAASRLTVSGAIIGTINYLSPEQIASREVDSRSDIYSLGTVLYECFVGEPPFLGGPDSVLYRVVHENPQPPRSRGAHIDEWLEELVLRCLAKDPARRPQRASEISEALRAYRSWLLESASEKTQKLSPGGCFFPRRTRMAPFVGRGREFAEIQTRLQGALEGDCQLVLLSGEAGIGKSRMLQEIETVARARRLRVLHGRFVEHDHGFPYQGFCEVIQEHFRSREAKPTQDFGDLAVELVSLFPVLTETAEFRSAPGEPAAPPAPRLSDPTAVFDLLARTILRIAGGRPLALLLEDLHEAAASIDALRYIIHRLGPTPTFIVGTYRKTGVDKRHPIFGLIEDVKGDRHFLQIDLLPFSLAESSAYVESLLSSSRVARELVENVFEATEGNPFFIKELVRSLLDSGGILEDEAGTFRLSEDTLISAGAMPPTIQQAVERRIAHLPAELRELLSVVSVVGRSFGMRDLKGLVESPALEDDFDRLIQEGLIEEEGGRGDRLVFSSGVIRDVLYASLSRRRRRNLHRRYAELLEERHAERRERVLPELVLHFSRGDVPDKTVRYGLLAAQKSLASFSPEDAIRTAKTVLEFLDEEWEGEASAEGEARLLLASAYRMTGNIDSALRETEQAIRVFQEGRHDHRVVAAMRTAAETAWQGRRTEAASRWLEEGIASARAAADTESLWGLLSLGATVANLRGEYQKGTEYLAEGERLRTGATAAERRQEPPMGGHLVVAMPNPIAAREPSDIQITEEAEVLSNVFETLLATDSRGNLQASLCERWESRDAGRSFLLVLREDARFHDGHLLNAADVKASFERSIRRAKRERRGAFVAIAGVAEFLEDPEREQGANGICVLSEREILIRLVEPLPLYPALLTDPNTAIARVPGGAEREEVLASGTGPFRYSSHAPERVVLEGHRDHWKGAPRLDRLEFRTSRSSADTAAGVRAGRYDLARDLLPDDMEDILRDPRFRPRFAEAPKKNTWFVLFNTFSPIAGRIALREAVAGVVRQSDLVWRTLGRSAHPATGLLPPGILGHDPGRRRRPLARQEALEVLRKASFEFPIRLKAAVHPLLQEHYDPLLSALFSLWTELGVEVSVETKDLPSFLASGERNQGIDLRIGRWSADYDDPDNFTHALFHSQNGLFRNYFSSPVTDRILEEARAESRPEVREGLYRRFENLILEGAILVPLFHDLDCRVANASVSGLRLRTAPPYVNYAELGKASSSPSRQPSREGRGGVLEVPIARDLKSLDPPMGLMVESTEVLPNIFETLTRDLQGQIVPWLAAEVEAEAGGRVFHFHLRDNVSFHDGRRLGARDVRWSLERLLLSNESEYRSVLLPIRGASLLAEGKAEHLDGFRILSSLDFVIELESPVSFFTTLLTHHATSIVPEGTAPVGRSWREGCVGTGPFRVVRFEPGRGLDLEPHPQYWREGYPRSDGLVFRFCMSPEEILREFLAGRLSLASDLFPADVEALLREPEFAAGYRETPLLSTNFVAFNAHDGPLADRRMRRRLADTVDVDTLVRRNMGRLAVTASGLIPPGLLGYERGGPARGGSVSPDTGLQEALSVTAAINPVYFGEYSSLLHDLIDSFRREGVHVSYKQQTLEEYSTVRLAAGSDMIVTRWNADYPDADSFAYNVVHSKGGTVGAYCDSPEIDHLVEEARSETDAGARHALYRQLEERIAQERLLLPLFHKQVYRFFRPEVLGLAVSFSAPVVRCDELWIR